jgi:GT2 family glycosyltransferase
VPLISVVIPVYRNASALVRCLDLLQQQSYPRDEFEVIVANNGSEADMVGIADAYPWVRLVFEPEGGSYAARNAAVRIAQGRVLAFTDSDCLPDTNWLQRGVAALQSDESIGLIVGKIEVIPLVANRPNIWEAYEMLFAFPQSRFVQRGFGATANLFTRIEVMDAVGPFRADFLSSGDVEWGRRVARAGFKIVMCPDAVVQHPARRTWREISRKLRRSHYGYYVRGDPYSWSRIILETRRVISSPARLLSGADAPWALRWRAALASVAVRSLEFCAQVELKLLGRPTLRNLSLKGW